MQVKFVADAQMLNPETQRYRKLRAGRIYDLTEEDAKRFVARSAAVEVAEDEPDTAAHDEDASEEE